MFPKSQVGKVCPTPESESEAEVGASLKRDKYVCLARGGRPANVKVQRELHLSRCTEHTRTGCCADVTWRSTAKIDFLQTGSVEFFQRLKMTYRGSNPGPR